jgi:cytoskeletal protein RodZ
VNSTAKKKKEKEKETKEKKGKEKEKKERFNISTGLLMYATNLFLCLLTLRVYYFYNYFGPRKAPF